MSRILAEPLTITIPHKPFTKKNGSRIVRTKAGIPFLLPSEAYEQYERDCGPFIRCKGMNISCACNLKALFFIDANRKCDLSNYMEAIADILVHYQVIEDDNHHIVKSWDGSRIIVDRAKPRTEITITPLAEEPAQTQLTLDDNF